MKKIVHPRKEMVTGQTVHVIHQEDHLLEDIHQVVVVVEDCHRNVTHLLRVVVTRHLHHVILLIVAMMKNMEDGTHYRHHHTDILTIAIPTINTIGKTHFIIKRRLIKDV